MNKKINIILAALLVFLGFTTSSCEDDKPDVAKAVLTSAQVLNYAGQNPAAQEIRVVSDATWTVDAPDWVTVSQTSGSGDLMVTISVTENLREGTLDNPRKGEVVFHGNTAASRAVVVIRQDGDKFRDVKPMTLAEAETAAEEAVVIANDLTVLAITSGKAFVVTDGTDVAYVTGAEAPAVGAAVNILGTKYVDAQEASYIEADEVTTATKVSEAPKPVDITENLDEYTSKKRTYVSVTGIIDGSAFIVADQKYTVMIDDATTDFSLSALNGHIVKLTGVYGGTAAPAVHLVVTSFEDLGVNEVIYWTEDFEWLAPWAAIGNGSACGSTVETNDPGANSPQLATPVIEETGVSAYDAILAKGYEIIATHAPSKSERKPQAQTYLQTNYLKFGLTGYYSGIIIPIDAEVPTDEPTVFEFDWCSQRQGSGAWDPTQLVVIITNGAETENYDVPPHAYVDNEAYAWLHAKFELPAGKIKKGTKITIRNCDAQWPVVDSAPALRWFLDNLKIKKGK